MKVIIGIDVGGSTTKIVGFTKDKKMIEPMFVTANDQITSVYGAFGKFTNTNNIVLSDIEKIMITGVGSTFVGSELYGIPCIHVREFDAIGRGGLYLSGLDSALVLSCGTGTAAVFATKDTIVYDGGTGVGGGTLVGLSKRMLGVSDINSIFELAKDGNLENVDLAIGDITKKDISPTLTEKVTAANFGKLSDLATPSDVALGLVNMVFETIAMIGLFAAKNRRMDNIVVIGTMTKCLGAKDKFNQLSKMFNMNYILPDKSRYGTVIGAALLAFGE